MIWHPQYVEPALLEKPAPSNHQGGSGRGAFFTRADRCKQNFSDSVSSGKIGNFLSIKVFSCTSSNKKLVH